MLAASANDSPGRNPKHGALVGHHHRTKGSGEDAHHPVAGGDQRHVGADLEHDAGAFDAWRSRLSRIHAKCVENIAEVEPCDVNRDADLPRRKRVGDPRRGGHHEVVERASVEICTDQGAPSSGTSSLSGPGRASRGAQSLSCRSPS